MGFVVGLLWKIGTKFQMGGRYQHKVKSSLSGSNYTRGGLGLPFSTVNGSITLPAELVLGVKFVPLNKLTLYLDFQRSSWSQTKGWTLQFDETQEHWDPYCYEDYWANIFKYSIETANQNAEQRLKDTWEIKFGLEYNLSDKFALRAGYAHLPSAVIGGAIHLIHPDLDRKIVSFGFGYEGPLFSIWNQKSMGELSVDFYIQYVMTEAQASSLPGFSFTFDNDHLVIGLGLGFNF
jgi:long-subunit fatty acid transport protein